MPGGQRTPPARTRHDSDVFEPPLEVPPGYPREMEVRLELDDGRHVFVRPVVPDDANELRRAIARADPQTIRRRFLGGRPPHSDTEIERLVTVDYDRRLALVAFDQQGRGIAVTRYEGSAGSDEAEVAVAVDPAWRHVGLASALIGLLGQAAVDRGIRRFAAAFYADNVDVTDLIAHMHVRGHREIHQGVVEESLSLVETADPPE